MLVYGELQPIITSINSCWGGGAFFPPRCSDRRTLLGSTAASRAPHVRQTLGTTLDWEDRRGAHYDFGGGARSVMCRALGEGPTDGTQHHYPSIVGTSPPLAQFTVVSRGLWEGTRGAARGDAPRRLTVLNTHPCCALNVIWVYLLQDQNLRARIARRQGWIGHQRGREAC